MPEIGAPHKLTHQDGGNDEISLLGLSGLLGDSQTPLAHNTTHQDGGPDEISVAGLAGRQIFIPYNALISTLTHQDTARHLLNLETALSETRKIIAILLLSTKTAGSGDLFLYPNEGNAYVSTGYQTWTYGTIIIADSTQRLQYSFQTSGATFDLFCIGYVVQS